MEPSSSLSIREHICAIVICDRQNVRHGFDPEVHRPLRLSPAQMERYGCDVSFVGCWSPEKERLISCILNSRRNLKAIVYGIGWKYASTEFKKTLGKNLRPGVFGDELAIVYNASKVALSFEEARTQIADYLRHYNDERLHSAIGYIAPKDKLEGRDRQIFTERDQKIEAAREARKQKRLKEKSTRTPPNAGSRGNF